MRWLSTELWRGSAGSTAS